jgi:hypothetical protein
VPPGEAGGTADRRNGPHVRTRKPGPVTRPASPGWTVNPTAASSAPTAIGPLPASGRFDAATCSVNRRPVDREPRLGRAGYRNLAEVVSGPSRRPRARRCARATRGVAPWSRPRHRVDRRDERGPGRGTLLGERQFPGDRRMGCPRQRHRVTRHRTPPSPGRRPPVRALRCFGRSANAFPAMGAHSLR